MLRRTPHTIADANRSAPSEKVSPEEVTGRASGTDDDLVSLFSNDSGEHIDDGFRGGSEGEAGSEGTEEQ